jgi:hypothetical protein
MQRSSVFDFSAEGRDEIPGKHLATPISLLARANNENKKSQL